jgi:uncharacterized OB-fold protein
MTPPSAKLVRRTAGDPLGRTDDPYAAFRGVALLEHEQCFHYRHSFGKASKFFLGLEEGKLLATRCPSCSSVWLPPRAVCPEDLTVTAWTELSGMGTLTSWTVCPQVPAHAHTEAPYILAYVALDGARTLFLHQLRNADPNTLYYGQRVLAVFTQGPTGHPLQRFWFEPS